MICGETNFNYRIGKYQLCTVPLNSFENPNHDMPGPDGKVRVHRSGEWTWATPYDPIGPETEYIKNTCWNCDEPFPEFQHDNLIPFEANAREIEMNLSYRCKGCQIHWAAGESRRENGLLEPSVVEAEKARQKEMREL